MDTEPGSDEFDIMKFDWDVPGWWFPVGHPIRDERERRCAISAAARLKKLEEKYWN